MMNRRQFLLSLAAAVVASRIPALATPQEPGLTLDILRRAVATLKENGVRGDDYIALVHPTAWSDFMAELSPKEQWKIAYRTARMRAKGRVVPEYTMEVGQFEGVRIFTSEVPV